MKLGIRKYVYDKVSGARRAYKIRTLRNYSSYGRGSADWLESCELLMGGYVDRVRRNKVSPHDPRTKSQLERGGMIGGDRMLHHGYSEFYAKHLERFIKENRDYVILECGILKGTGLALWSVLFPSSTVIGIDIDLDYTKQNLENLKARGAFPNSLPTLIEFDQYEPNVEEIERVLGGRRIDIAIDDGTHQGAAIHDTLAALEHLLADRFVYFIEDNRDVHRSLRSSFKDKKVFSYGELTVLEEA